MPTASFAKTPPVFFQRLREVTEAYFKENNLRKTGDGRLYWKTVVLLSALVSLYIVLVFFTPASAWLSLSFCALLGLVVASVGFNVMHDGAHGSYSSRKWVNELMGHSLNLLGGSVHFWKLKHNVNHHTFTNIEGMDDDIDIKPFVRVHPGQKRYWFHRFQHIYGLLLYGLTYLFWIFYNDLKKYFTGKIADNTRMKPLDLKEHLIFWATKVGYAAVFLGLPMYFAGVVPSLVGYGMMVFVTGLFIAVVFQLAHVVEHAEFVNPETDGEQVQSEWAVHQLATTANFATNNKLWNWLFGGLNFQVEHHLFPKICHIHYPEINKRLKQVCAEFNVNYREFPSLRSALWSHLVYLRQAGMA
ncbi:MAG: acyl-CoA desaturase [Bacteroidetes bacterium]|nr:acyl-CoA desaturase [Bacteroidota bacterium]